MKLSLIRVLPLAIALLVPSAALAEDHPAKSADAKPAAGATAGHKPRATHTAKRAKAGPKAKPVKAPKASKAVKAPKASKKAPKASKKAAK